MFINVNIINTTLPPPFGNLYFFFQTALFIISLFPFSPLFLALFCLFSPVVWLPPLGRTNSPNLLTFTSSVLIMSSIRPVPSVPLPAMLTHHHHHRRCLVMGSTVRPIKVKLASSHHHSTATSPIEEWTTALEEPAFSFSSFLLLWQFVALDCHEFRLFIRESALNSRAHHEPAATAAAVTVSPLLSASLANCDHDANLELQTSLQCYVYSSFLHSPALTCLVIYIISTEWTTAAAAGSAGACFVGLLCDNLLSLSPVPAAIFSLANLHTATSMRSFLVQRLFTLATLQCVLLLPGLPLLLMLINEHQHSARTAAPGAQSTAHSGTVRR